MISGKLGLRSMQNKMIFLVFGLIVVAIILVSFMTIRQFDKFGEATTEKVRTQIIMEREEKMKNLVDTAVTLMDEYNKRAAGGELTQDDARQRAFKRIGAMRYDEGKGYFWIHSAGDQPVMVMHPIKPETNGKNLSQEEDFAIVKSLYFNGQVYAKDSDTVMKNIKPSRLFIEMNKVTAEKGEGLVKYYWSKPGMDSTVGYPKISYVKLFKPWNLVLGTGMYINDVDKEVAKARQETQENIKQAVLMFGISLAISLVIALFLTILFARHIVLPVNYLVSAADRLAQGDLSTKITVKTHGEVGHLANSFEQMRMNFKGLIGSIAHSGSLIFSAAETLSSQAEQTAAAATSNASSVGEIASTIDTVVDNIKEVSGQAQEASQQAGLGQQNVDTIVKTMQAIEQSEGQVAESVGSLNSAIEKIGKFVDTINAIADQTNLLALNAAIEAARAGDAGRGFAVVADEVRKLAEGSVQSAKEINNIISEVKQQADKAVKDMENGREKVAQGNLVVKEVSQSLIAIIKLVQDLNFKTQEVATAAGQVTGAVQNVAATTEQQTASMEEVSASAFELNNISTEMSKMLAKFKM